MTEFSEKYLEEVRKKILLAVRNIELYSKNEDSKEAARSIRNLLKRGESGPLDVRAESIFASKLILTSVLEKVREGKIGKKQMELDRMAYDLKDVSLAGAHGGPIVGLITHAVRRILNRVTGEREFREKVGKIALKCLESAKMSEDYKKDLKAIIKERVPRTF
ncbi:MAG: hypothetical protein KAX04_05460 [Methanomicrobia archaeon]|nr:hypothetical protein [Methanomicrobia archaeon]